MIKPLILITACCLALPSLAMTPEETDGLFLQAEASGWSQNTAQLFILDADQGFRDAQYRSGLIYLRGLGVSRDFRQARHYFQLAADQNHPEALFNLALMWKTGDGGKVDIRRANQLFARAAQAGNIQAQATLAYHFEEGIGFKQNLAMADALYRLAQRKELVVSAAVSLPVIEAKLSVYEKDQADLIVTNIINSGNWLGVLEPYLK